MAAIKASIQKNNKPSFVITILFLILMRPLFIWRLNKISVKRSLLLRLSFMTYFISGSG